MYIFSDLTNDFSPLSLCGFAQQVASISMQMKYLNAIWSDKLSMSLEKADKSQFWSSQCGGRFETKASIRTQSNNYQIWRSIQWDLMHWIKFRCIRFCIVRIVQSMGLCMWIVLLYDGVAESNTPHHIVLRWLFADTSVYGQTKKVFRKTYIDPCLWWCLSRMFEAPLTTPQPIP